MTAFAITNCAIAAATSNAAKKNGKKSAFEEVQHEKASYRETIFDAYLFLGRIYVMDENYIKAEEAFNEAERRVHDSPYEWKLPLCPENVREKAELIRSE